MKLKTIKTILATGILSLSLAGLANAQGQGGVTYAYITGSTAFRNSVFNVIATNTFDATPTFYGYGNSAAAKCNYMIFSNTIGTVPYIIKCEWSGSEAGILDCASNIQETFPGDADLGNAGTFTIVNSTGTPPSPDVHQNDVGMADNSQSYSRTLKPSLTGTTVGVIPFTWIKNAQAPADLTGTLGTDWTNWVNLTREQTDAAILDNGTPLSTFTGVQTETNFVYVAGRNNNSGTRANQLLDMSLPVGQFVSQIYITGGSKTDHTVPITMENQLALGINSSGKTYLGTDGQDSGGTLATTMNYLGSASQKDINDPYAVGGGGNVGWFAVAYLGRSDANSVLGANGNAVEMLFNGVASTSANIESGVYPCWGNEWIYKAKNDSANSTAQTTLYNAIVNHIVANLDGTTGIPFSSMHVYRQSSGSVPYENGF